MPAHHILFYEYVPDAVQRRAPYREEHLARIGAERDAGRIVMSGPLGEPSQPTGAAIVFGEGVAVADIEAFAAEDPYVTGGIVTAQRIERWNVI